MESRDKGSKLPRDEFLVKLERMLRSDTLLMPYFDKGYIHILDKPGMDPIWIDFTLKEEIQASIKRRLMAVLLGKGDEFQAEAIRKSDERDEMEKVLRADEVLRPYFEDDSISMTNLFDTGFFELDPDPEKLHIIITRVIKVLKDHFGDVPDDDSQT